jgi:hypothetical protein
VPPPPAAGAQRGATGVSGSGAPRVDGCGGAAGTGAAPAQAARRGGLKRWDRGRPKKLYGSRFCAGIPPGHGRGARWPARRRCGGSRVLC